MHHDIHSFWQSYCLFTPLLRHSFCLFTPQKTVHGRLKNGPHNNNNNNTLSSPWSVGFAAEKKTSFCTCVLTGRRQVMKWFAVVVVVSICGGEELLKTCLLRIIIHAWKSRRVSLFSPNYYQGNKFHCVNCFFCFPLRCPRLTRGAPSARKARMWFGRQIRGLRHDGPHLPKKKKLRRGSPDDPTTRPRRSRNHHPS